MSTLLVASTGGHLKELHCLLPRLRGHDGDLVWVTNDTIQSRTLLAGQEVLYVPYQGSRNVRGGVANGRSAWRILGTRPFTSAISTGSGIALSFLPLAHVRGAQSHYIESGTRVCGPSLTGRALRRIPGAHCYTQYPDWASEAWLYRGSVLDGFSLRESLLPQREIRRVVVTLGTWRQSFRRLVDRLMKVLPREAETLWQTGATNVDDLPIRAVPWLAPAELAQALRKADLVVTHAGMGAALDALESGRCPVVVARRKASGEQVDDHQVELAAELERRGLGVARSPEELTYDALVLAASRRVDAIVGPAIQLEND